MTKLPASRGSMRSLSAAGGNSTERALVDTLRASRLRVRLRATEPWVDVQAEADPHGNLRLNAQARLCVEDGRLLELEIAADDRRLVGFSRVLVVEEDHLVVVGPPVGLRSADRRSAPRVKTPARQSVTFVLSGGRRLDVLDLSPQGLRLVVGPELLDDLAGRGLRGMLRLPGGNAVRVLVEARHHRRAGARTRGQSEVGCRFVGLGPVERADIAAAVGAVRSGS